MGLCNELSCEVGSFSGHLSPCSFFHSEVLRLYFPTLEPWVGQFVSLPSCSLSLSVFKCATPGPPAAALPHVLSAQLSISAPPTGLDKCFFFISLVIELPYSSIFCQFWLFLNCCCPSFGCARRHSVSTYASILARSPVCFPCKATFTDSRD